MRIYKYYFLLLNCHQIQNVMKNILLSILFFPLFSYSQIGIGTENPTRTLDVNGDLRIRTTTATVRESAAKDSIITVGATGNITRVSSKTVVESHLKSFVKGSFPIGGTGTISMSITAGGYTLIPFNTEEFDINEEFNPLTGIFTAKASGIYSVSVNVKTTPALLSLSNDFGLAIFKNSDLKVRNSYANVSISLIGIGLVNASPPVRSLQTLVQLNAGDTVSFRAYSSGAILSTGLIVGSGEDSFFTI